MLPFTILTHFYRPALFNYRSRSIQQSSTVGKSLSNAPYTNAGLRGDGQIVAVADTGVNVNSCYFYDPTGQVAFSPTTSPVISIKYRKLLMYTHLAGAGDTSDEASGHGTHVAGTIVGSIASADITTSKKLKPTVSVYTGV